jgi:hypothetical protein
VAPEDSGPLKFFESERIPVIEAYAQRIDALELNELVEWLARALEGLEMLPRATADEYPSIAIQRMEMLLGNGRGRRIHSACVELVRRFAERLEGTPDYQWELLALARELRLADAPRLLSKLANDWNRFTALTHRVQLAVLAGLVGSPDQADIAFWEGIAHRDPEKYTLLALSGVLAIKPMHAARLLPLVPNEEMKGHVAVIKLDHAWKALGEAGPRNAFARAVRDVLPRCGDQVRAALEPWVEERLPTTQEGQENLRLRSYLSGKAPNPEQLAADALGNHSANDTRGQRDPRVGLKGTPFDALPLSAPALGKSDGIEDYPTMEDLTSPTNRPETNRPVRGQRWPRRASNKPRGNAEVWAPGAVAGGCGGRTLL